ncbi:MAG: RluA family pseudouridine synthase [Lachnospiraceae bacterium]
MREVSIEKKDSGQRLDKYLKKYFPGASGGFLYKMMRKKNIILNGKKAAGDELLKEGDRIKVFFSEETFEKMHQRKEMQNTNSRSGYQKAYKQLKGIEVILELQDVIFLSKPAGILSQGSDSGEPSLNDWLIGYLMEKGACTDFHIFKPSICNRLDRNTSGVVMCGKTYRGSRFLTDCIRNHQLTKKYLAIIEGIPDATFAAEGELKGYHKKNTITNRVTITRKRTDADESFVHTVYHILSHDATHSLAEVELVTGKSHQIRAHFSSVGHPLAGDTKYGGHSYKGQTKQFLHAYQVVFPQLDEEWKDLSHRVIEAKPPKEFQGFQKNAIGC